MSVELYFLALTAIMTALFWLPYALNRILSRGLMTAMGNPEAGDVNPYVRGLAPWAERAYFAHVNAVENLVVFAALVLIANAAAVSSDMTVLACQVYFFARLLHYVIYTAGIPVLRTLLYAASWLATLFMGFATIGLM